MSKTVSCIGYVDVYIFWEYSQSDIDKVLESFKDIGTSSDW